MRSSQVPPRAFEGWHRRLVMLPLFLLATPILLLFSPLLFLAAAAADLVTGPRRRRWSRLLAMSLHYLVLESIGIMVAGALWVATGFGLAMRTRWSQDLHHRVQLWWTRSLFGAVEQWLGAALFIDGDEHLSRGPIVIVARHSSFFDAMVPAVALGRVTRTVGLHHILKRELAWDPCLDLYGHRLPNHFVNRLPRERDGELDAIRELGEQLGDGAAVIFPEGTFRSPARAARELERVAERDPDRHQAVARLHHHLPVRPGGVLSLLAGADGADVVFLTHTGFEPFGSFRDIIANVPFRRPIIGRAWRIPANELPDDDHERLALIDHWWQVLDDWVDLHR